MAGLGHAYTNTGASGDLAGTVVLDDTTNFLSTSTSSSRRAGCSLHRGSTLVSGIIPDTFTMVIIQDYDPNSGYDPMSGPIPSVIPTADTTINTFLTLDINGPGDTTAMTYAGGANGEIPITVTPASVPELSSGAMTLFGLLAIAGAIRLPRSPKHGGQDGEVTARCRLGAGSPGHSRLSAERSVSIIVAPDSPLPPGQGERRSLPGLGCQTHA